MKSFAELTGMTKDDIDGQYDCFDEEHQELIDAVKADDRVEMLDAIIDMTVVKDNLEYLGESPTEMARMINHEANKHHFSESVLHEALIRVYRSNMSKFPDCVRTLKRSMLYLQHKGIIALYREHDEHYIIYSALDQHDQDAKFYPKGKVLKGVDYVAPVLSDLV